MSNWITNAADAIAHAFTSVFGSTAAKNFLDAEKNILKTALGVIAKDAVTAVQQDVTSPLSEAQWATAAATIAAKAAGEGIVVAGQEIDLLIGLFSAVKVS